jgi:hypothetical protein
MNTSFEERGYGFPLQERERAARHFGIAASEVTPQMIENLPPRGTGLETGRARGSLSENEINQIAEAVAAKVSQSWYDSILGECKLDGAYLTNQNYGGYNYHCDRGSGAVDYAQPENVLEIAKKEKLPKIHLAGDAWRDIGHRGYGEEVPTEEGEKLLNQLREYRTGPVVVIGKGDSVCDRYSGTCGKIIEIKDDEVVIQPTIIEGKAGGEYVEKVSYPAITVKKRNLSPDYIKRYEEAHGKVI